MVMVQDQQRKKKGVKKKKRVTQDELLAEAAHTEVVNQRSLAVRWGAATSPMFPGIV